MVAQQVAVREREPLGLPVEVAPAPPLRRRESSSLLRRRRVLLVLAALTAGTLLIAIGSGSPAAWAVFLVVLVVGAAYLALVHHVRRVLAEREFATLLRQSDADGLAWGDLGRPIAPDEFNRSGPAPARGAPQTWALLRFVLANMAGWALSPVVFVMTLLLGRTPQDTTGQRWLANMQAAQERLREQSLRTLAISAATTASVTAAGTVGALAGTGTASAASLPTGATLASGTGVPAAVTSSTYRVMAGDTLGSIAARFGTTVAALTSLNHLANPNLIYVGQVLRIGGSGSGGSGPSWGPPAGGTYRVMAGDTLGSIAARFGTTVAALASLNHLANPNLIYVGQVLRLNGSGAPPPSTGGGGSSGGGTATASTYRVMAGDTLGSVAARFGTTVAALTSLNHLANPNLIYVGEILRLSGSAGSGSAPPPPTPAPTPPPAQSSAGAAAARVAVQQVGKPYQWAGAGPNSYDCSGLVMYAWAHAGVSLPHYSVAQYLDTARISRSQLQPGDLVFYNTGGGAQPGHVTIYIGNGQIVTADHPGTVVRIKVVNWDGVPMGYGRVR